MLELLLFLMIALPLAWMASEAQRHRWISIVLGCGSLAIVAFAVYAWTAFWTGFYINESFGDASKSFAIAIVQELEAGEVEQVKDELTRFVKRYDPNYENYPRYGDVVDETVERLRQD